MKGEQRRCSEPTADNQGREAALRLHLGLQQVHVQPDKELEREELLRVLPSMLHLGHSPAGPQRGVHGRER